MPRTNTTTKRRRNAARKDARVGTIERDIEAGYGLPPGSVQVTNANGTNARSDKRIGRLRAEYGWDGPPPHGTTN